MTSSLDWDVARGGAGRVRLIAALVGVLCVVSLGAGWVNVAHGGDDGVLRARRVSSWERPGVPPHYEVIQLDPHGAAAAAGVRAAPAVPVHAGGQHRAPADEPNPPGEVLSVAGRLLHETVGAHDFVACALATISPPDGAAGAGPRLRLANGAQVTPLLCRGGETIELETPGERLPLGIFARPHYQDLQVELRPGDVVVFSSDGFAEAPACAAAVVPAHLPPPVQPGELFGFERLAASAAHWAQHGISAGAKAEGIWADVTAWCGEDSHHDDMTLLVLRVLRGPG